MTHYREFRGYSSVHDARMVRLSAADEHGREFFMMLPEASGDAWRKRREEALDAIEEAISQGCEPGEVRILEAA